MSPCKWLGEAEITARVYPAHGLLQGPTLGEMLKSLLRLKKTTLYSYDLCLPQDLMKLLGQITSLVPAS